MYLDRELYVTRTDTSPTSPVVVADGSYKTYKSAMSVCTYNNQPTSRPTFPPPSIALPTHPPNKAPDNGCPRTSKKSPLCHSGNAHHVMRSGRKKMSNLGVDVPAQYMYRIYTPRSRRRACEGEGGMGRMKTRKSGRWIGFYIYGRHFAGFLPTLLRSGAH